MTSKYSTLLLGAMILGSPSKAAPDRVGNVTVVYQGEKTAAGDFILEPMRPLGLVVWPESKNPPSKRTVYNCVAETVPVRSETTGHEVVNVSQLVLICGDERFRVEGVKF